MFTVLELLLLDVAVLCMRFSYNANSSHFEWFSRSFHGHFIHCKLL